MAKRPGRKRKAVDTRRPDGRLIHEPRKDRGTVELQNRRQFLAQDGDPTKATYPLGILWANQQITEDEHLAGCKFASYHAIIYGRESVAAVRYGITVGGRDNLDPLDPLYIEWMDRIKAGLRLATEALDALSRSHRDLMINIAVRESYPRWMLPRVPTPTDLREARKFKEAISALAQAMASGKRRAA